MQRAHAQSESTKVFESQVRIEHKRMMKLQEKLDTKTAELKHLQDVEASRKDNPDISHEELGVILCAMLHRYRRSQNPQELPIAIGEGTEDGSKKLAGMLRDFLMSHAREVNEAKAAKDRHRKFLEEYELLEQRLANAETQKSTDRLVVKTALSRMEGCMDSEVKMLKDFFRKHETHCEFGSQEESSTSK